MAHVVAGRKVLGPNMRIPALSALAPVFALALAASTGSFMAADEQPKGPDPAFARKVVTYPSPEPTGTIIVDPGSHYLYRIQGDGTAIRYGVGVGVGAEGFVWNGLAVIHTKQEWPDWYPPAECWRASPSFASTWCNCRAGSA